MVHEDDHPVGSWGNARWGQRNVSVLTVCSTSRLAGQLEAQLQLLLCNCGRLHCSPRSCMSSFELTQGLGHLHKSQKMCSGRQCCAVHNKHLTSPQSAKGSNKDTFPPEMLCVHTMYTYLINAQENHLVRLICCIT